MCRVLVNLYRKVFSSVSVFSDNLKKFEVVPAQPIKADSWSGGIAPLFPNLGTRWR